MKCRLVGVVVVAIIVASAMGTFARAAAISYDAGVSPGSGVAADPAGQEWTLVGGVANGTGASDSGKGGWRTIDGTGHGCVFYSHALSADVEAQMGSKWDLSVTFSPDRSYDLNGETVVDYYYDDPVARTKGTGIQITGAAGSGYELYFRGDADKNLVLYDLGSSIATTLTTDGSYFDTFHTLTLRYDNGVAKVDYNGNLTTVTAFSTGNPSTLIFGELSSNNDGSVVWNNVSLAVPEPCALTLVATGLIGLLAYAWRKHK